ncbi:hypothetical protein N7520_002542 [Penicillium odoratum]|uniref:uncharacterized protein n=1 Tax=Penicillium odoratum TaxID=1167516 RepID=UPI00254793D1|nr:uncharacterized protein N7520_002542 [Penicillium odoratum]KAJ5772013.1 hypothetical protein N7520_002542 [Penicillium odoratum]
MPWSGNDDMMGLTKLELKTLLIAVGLNARENKLTSQCDMDTLALLIEKNSGTIARRHLSDGTRKLKHYVTKLEEELEEESK